MTQPLEERDRRRRKPHRRGHGAAVEKRAARLPRGKSPEKSEPKFWSGQKLSEADPIAALALLSRGAVVVDDERAAIEIERARAEVEKARQDRAAERARKAQRRAEREAARVAAAKAKAAWVRNVAALARMVAGEGLQRQVAERVYSKLEPKRLRKGVERVLVPSWLTDEWWRAYWPRLRAMKYRARVIRARLREIGRETWDREKALAAELEWRVPRVALVQLARIYASGGLRKGKPATRAGLELLGGGRV
jgi:hypothetical protein